MLIGDRNLESVQFNHHNIAKSSGNLSANICASMESQDDEEVEDVDFNPFLRCEISEASSSLSSENECSDDHLKENPQSTSCCMDASPPHKETNEAHFCFGNSENADEIALQTALSKKNNNEDHSFFTKEVDEQCPIIDTSNDNDDAIYRRTRAHHSLANHTLEELEAFLQESDDDNDVQNVGEEKEYHKFLDAVLQGEGENIHFGPADENSDEDENDEDFMIEIEEALDSDSDADTRNGRKDMQEGETHRPVTRQKKCQKESVIVKNLAGHTKLPFRPMLPCLPNEKEALAKYGWQFLSPKCPNPRISSSSCTDLRHGFTYYQTGQLYCLIHEHVQLLIQIFSISVLDPSRQQFAIEIQGMISEMICRREDALRGCKAPFPDQCFFPAHFHSSMCFDSNQNAGLSSWMPVIDKPIKSVLDVAPLRLLKDYMTDVSAAVSMYRHMQMKGATDMTYRKKEPLFSMPPFGTPNKTTNDGREHATTRSLNTILAVLPGHTMPKKSMAATLVDGTKDEPVALVPLDIAKLAQRFCPLFNPSLFPHKPPLLSVVNRLLFTDAEDRLLAMGIAECNSDWVAIQQRFLPCKSEHQIFVRQKNRNSSNAPENPIKAVRRMKTSPLTLNEKEKIDEGLILFKQDWFAIWKFCVPHRDPSTLQRLWRIASGSQKSYKSTRARKEKRRLYEAGRRQRKDFLVDQQRSSRTIDGGVNCEDEVQDQDEDYVHEAFMANSQLGVSNSKPSDIALPLTIRSNLPSFSIFPDESSLRTEIFTHDSNDQRTLPQISGHAPVDMNSLKPPDHMQHISHPLKKLCSPQASSQLPCQSSSHALGMQLESRPHCSRKKHSRIVKLAPELPPVNLPCSVRVISRKNHSHIVDLTSELPPVNLSRSVRVISQASFMGQQSRPGKVCSNATEHSGSPGANSSQDGYIPATQNMCEKMSLESDFHIHPLLFQTPMDRFSSHHAVNCNATSASAYKVFPRSQFHADFDLTESQQSPRAVGIGCTETSEDLQIIDFHPLLQRNKDVTSDPSILPSASHLDDDTETVKTKHNQLIGNSRCMLRSLSKIDTEIPAIVGCSSLCEMENALDLDIHLYSLPCKDKTCGTTDVSKHDKLIRPVLDNGMMGRSENILEHSDSLNRCLEPIVSTASLINSSDASDRGIGSIGALPSSFSAYQCEDGLSNDSLHGIIMEQEELSDSDEESELVEFECEEIDDSEAEMDHENLTEVQNLVATDFPGLNGAQTNFDLNRLAEPTTPSQRLSGRLKGCWGSRQLVCPDKLSSAKLRRQRTTKKDPPCKKTTPTGNPKKSGKKGDEGKFQIPKKTRKANPPRSRLDPKARSLILKPSLSSGQVHPQPKAYSWTQARPNF